LGETSPQSLIPQRQSYKEKIQLKKESLLLSIISFNNTRTIFCALNYTFSFQTAEVDFQEKGEGKAI